MPFQNITMDYFNNPSAYQKSTYKMAQLAHLLQGVIFEPVNNLIKQSLQEGINFADNFTFIIFPHGHVYNPLIPPSYVVDLRSGES